MQPKSRYSRTAPNKPLPEDPDLVARAVAATLPKLHPIPFEERWERPRQHVEAPQRGHKPSTQEPRIAKFGFETAGLATFFRDTGPDDESIGPKVTFSKSSSRAPQEQEQNNTQQQRPQTPTKK